MERFPGHPDLPMVMRRENGVPFGFEDFFPVHLSLFQLSWSLLLLVAYHQSEMNLVWVYFVNSLQSYDCNNSDFN